MLASLDQFVFGLSTAAYLQLQRRTNWKHPTSSRVGGRNGRQFTGAGDDSITLSGLLAPDDGIGKLASIDELRTMGDTGDAFVFVDGAGNVYGAFIIESVDDTRSILKSDGTPKKLEFTISLTRVDESLMRSKSTSPTATDQQ